VFHLAAQVSVVNSVQNPLVDMQVNYGGTFTWWDRLFGTYRDQAARGPAGIVFGVEGFDGRKHQTLPWILAQPFLHEHGPDSATETIPQATPASNLCPALHPTSNRQMQDRTAVAPPHRPSSLLVHDSPLTRGLIVNRRWMATSRKKARSRRRVARDGFVTYEKAEATDA
jgi:hypothetical protein